MQMNRRERKELALSKLVLLGLAVLGIFIVVWLAWVWPSMRSSNNSIQTYKACVEAGNPIRESYPSVCVTKDGKSFVNPDEQASPAPSSGAQTGQTTPQPSQQKYLTIKEWGVRAALPATAEDLLYTYIATDLGDRTSFTFGRLQTIAACKTDVGVSMSRTGVKNQPPYDIENPEPVAHVGSYYYYLAYAGSPCYDPSNAEHMKLANSIAGGSSPNMAVRQILQTLQAAP